MDKPILSKEFLEKHIGYMSISDMVRRYGYCAETIRRAERKHGISRANHPTHKTIITALKGTKHTSDWKMFYDMNEIASYYLGYFFADACLYKRKNNRSIQFYWLLHSGDRHIMEQFLQDCNATYPLKTIPGRVRVSKGNTWNEHESCRLAISSIEFSAILCKYGMDPMNEYKQHLPKIYYIQHFLRGLLDGDGHISTRKKERWPRLTVIYSIKEKTFADELSAFLESYGYNPSVYKSGSIYQLRMHSTAAGNFLDWIYTGANRRLNRKYETYLWWKAYKAKARTTPPLETE